MGERREGTCGPLPGLEEERSGIERRIGALDRRACAERIRDDLVESQVRGIMESARQEGFDPQPQEEPRCGTCGEPLCCNDPDWHHSTGDQTERADPPKPWADGYEPVCKRGKPDPEVSAARIEEIWESWERLWGQRKPVLLLESEGRDLLSALAARDKELKAAQQDAARLRAALKISKLETQCAEKGWPEPKRLAQENARLREALTEIATFIRPLGSMSAEPTAEAEIAQAALAAKEPTG